MKTVLLFYFIVVFDTCLQIKTTSEEIVLRQLRITIDCKYTD